MRLSALLSCIVMVFVASEMQGPVHAYLDPGTGSIVIQAVVAAVVGALAVGRMYWSRLKSLIGRTEPEDPGDR